MSGTLNWITGYIGYSNVPAEQQGNYLALTLTSDVEGATITASFDDKTVTLGEDNTVVIRFTDGVNQVVFTATKEGYSAGVMTLDLSEINRDPDTINPTTLTGALPLYYNGSEQTGLIDYRFYGTSDGVGTAAQLGIQLDEPLRGLGDVKDTLDVSTGVLTRRIGVVVLDGTEGQIPEGNTTRYFFKTIANTVIATSTQDQLCSHYSYGVITTGTENVGFRVTVTSQGDTRIAIRSPNTDLDTTEEYRAFYASEYANGRPVTAYYVLANPVTEQVDVPSGLSGIIEGYLTQTGTPTESNPIYPEANGVKLPNGKYEVYADVYKIPIINSQNLIQDEYDIYIGDTKLRANEYVDYSEQKIYKYIEDVLTPIDPPAVFPGILAYEGENILSSTEIIDNAEITGLIEAIEESSNESSDENSNEVTNEAINENSNE